MTDLYAILGIEKTATGDEIKRAYRQKARIHHPDAGGAADAFSQINHAYDTLANEQRRAHYDKTGESEARLSPEDVRARVLLDDILRKYVDQPDATGRYTFDLVRAMRADLDEGDRRIPIYIKEIQDRIASIERLIARCDGAFLLGSITQIARQLEARIIHFDAERAAIAKARVMLVDCRHAPERDLAGAHIRPQRQV